MSAEKVILFRSTDGVLHETEQACLGRNFVLESRPKIRESILNNAELDAEMPAQLSVDAVCDWVLKCTPEILSILTPLVVPLDAPRRRRRTKADMALEKAAQAVLQAQSGIKPSSADQAQTLNEFAGNEAKLLAVGPAQAATVVADGDGDGDGTDVSELALSGAGDGPGFPD